MARKLQAEVERERQRMKRLSIYTAKTVSVKRSERAGTSWRSTGGEEITVYLDLGGDGKGGEVRRGGEEWDENEEKQGGEGRDGKGGEGFSSVQVDGPPVLPRRPRGRGGTSVRFFSWGALDLDSWKGGGPER